MRPWPNPEFMDLSEWAAELIAELALFEIDLAATRNVGQIGEFVTLPEGYLTCDGSSFDALSFPVLNQILGGNTLPNLTPVYNVSYVVGIRAA